MYFGDMLAWVVRNTYGEEVAEARVFYERMVRESAKIIDGVGSLIDNADESLRMAICIVFSYSSQGFEFQHFVLSLRFAHHPQQGNSRFAIIARY